MSGSFSAIGLLALLALVLAFPVSTVGAAPAFRMLPQPASHTATPRIQLPTASATRGASPTAGATAGASATASTSPTASTLSPGAPPASPTALRQVQTPAGPPGPEAPGGRATREAGRGGPTEAGSAGGSSGDGTAGPGETGVGISGGGGSAAGDRGESGEADASGRGPAFVDGAERAPGLPGPRGLLSTPVLDPGLQRIWAAQGSPRQGQSWGRRLTEGRPGPWRYALFYPLLALLLALAFARAWRALRGIAAGSGRA